MDKKNLIPQTAKPVVRVTQGTQTHLKAELGEEVLSGSEGVTPHNVTVSCIFQGIRCSMDDDAE